MIHAELLTATLNLIALLALVTAGFNLVYGVLGFLNIAHSEVVVLGALLTYKLSGVMSFPAAVLLGILLTSTAGLIVGRVLFSPLRLFPKNAMLATSLGLALVLQVCYTAMTRQASVSLRPEPTVFRFISVDYQSTWFLLVITLLAVGSLQLWLQRTKLGQSLRAISENLTLAEAWGLPVSLAYDVVFSISFALAGIAGAFVALHYSTSFGFAFKILIWSFSAMLVGGLGRLTGGLIACVPISFAWVILERLGVEPYVDSLLLFLCACFYLAFPEGILGRRLRIV